MRPPVIGITTARSDKTKSGYKMTLNEVYTASVARTGGIPLMIPLGLPSEALSSLLETLDGVLFSGGGDVAPERYGSTLHPKVDGVDPDRDRVELELFEKAVERKTPFLGICRGLQLINVALGGKLYEDLADQRPASLPHQAPDRWPRERVIHPVFIEEKSRLHEILQMHETGVNSHHHQGVKEPGKGLKITAVAPDGVIEAVELKNYPFGLAVQWHPEWMPADPAMQALFSAFVQAAGSSQTG